MTVAPEISVVMGVYNGADNLDSTIQSVLSQRGVGLELIVVDDGSTDRTPDMLSEYAAGDDRVRVLTQPNRGLTHALIAGCAAARGRYIARQDCGDVSLPSRLARQRDLLDASPDAVMVTCATGFVGPAGEPLYVNSLTTEELRAGLSELRLDSVRGPSHHGSTMFSREAYQRAGGYRAAFAVAQDLDLWLRLAELGPCLAMPEVLYEAKLAPGAISATRRKEQLATAAAILECAVLRRAGESDDEAVERWNRRRGPARRRLARRLLPGLDDARFYHFVASALRRSDPTLSRRYYALSIRSSLFYPRPWLGLARLMVTR